MIITVPRWSQRQLSLSRAMVAVVLLVSAATFAHGQTQRFCEGELGQADWACEALSPVAAEVFEEFLPLPGSPDPANPAKYKQIAGDLGFDEDTGMRNDKAAVFVVTEGTYFCMLAESNGEAVLFDAPEGSFVSSTTRYPTSSWLPQSVGALLAEGTKLKYIVYTHVHWDHIGAAGLVADYFSADEPMAISSRRPRRMLKGKEKRDPNTSFGNNRGVPLPEWYQEEMLEVGGLRFALDKAHVHQAGDYLIRLDKNDPANADAGIATTIVMVTDAIFPGWSPFFSFAVAEDAQGYLEGLEQVNEVDFDVLVGGHISRLGTKEDVQIKVDYFGDILAGAEHALATVAASDVAVGTGVFDPTNANAGNTWLVFNEYIDRVVDVCYDYVLDTSGRRRDWLAELAGVEVTLRSHCTVMQSFVRIG